MNTKDLFIPTSLKGLNDFNHRISNMKDVVYAGGRKVIENVYLE